MADQRIPASQRVTQSSGGTGNSSSNMGFKGIDAKSAKMDISTAVANPMGDVEQPSYHFKFYIGTDTGTSTTPVVTIAETGLTTFNITDVEIDAIVAPNFQTKNIGATKFTIKISEPLGMALPDKMAAGAAAANVQNFMKCPYFLSVDFLGYDPESGAPKRPVDKTWIWSLFITKMTTDLDATGGKHVIEAVGYNEIGNFDQFNLIKMPIQIDFNKGEGKVKEVMEGVAKQINKALEKSYNVANGGTAPFTVEIKDLPYKNGGVVNSPFEHKIIRDQKFLDSSRNQGVAQISRGTDIGRLIDYIMSVSETATQMINPAESATENDSEAKEYSTAHRVDTVVENVSYDTISQDYVRRIIFYVRGHDNVRAVNSAKGADDALAQGQAKLAFVTGQNYLKKEYQYLFTGRNTEVLDFNISLNFNFAIATNIMQGHITTENSSSGIQYSPDDFNKQTMNEKWPTYQNAIVPINYCKAPAVGGSPTTTTDLWNGLNQPSNGSIDSLGFGPSALPMTFIQDGNDPRVHVNQAVEASNLRSRSIYAGILNQLYGDITENLGKVDLLIRGDPYWLGATNTESIQQDSTDEKANFSNGEHMFMLKFLLPQGIDDDGNPILTLTDTYSGFYATISVTHKFNGGVFTQNLNGVRIPAMRVSELLGGK